MPGIESFGRKSSEAGATSYEIENAQHMPAIEYGLSNIKFCVHKRLSRRFQKNHESKDAIMLAYCVTNIILHDPIVQPIFLSFSKNQARIIEREISDLFKDEELVEPIILAYAARMILLGWETGNPFNPVANEMTKRATDNGMLIPNIIQMWGAEAMVTFVQYSQKFLISSLNA